MTNGIPQGPTLQLTGIKIALGIFNNTPSHAVLAESGEILLSLRISWPAQKDNWDNWRNLHSFQSTPNQKNLVYENLIRNLKTLQNPREWYRWWPSHKEATQKIQSKLSKITNKEAELICKNHKEFSQAKGIIHWKKNELDTF